MRAWGELLSSKRTRVRVEGNPFSNLHTVLVVAKGTLALSRAKITASPRGLAPGVAEASHRSWGRGRGLPAHAGDKEITFKE